MKKVFFCVFVGVALFGCSPSSEELHSMDYYEKNPDELAAKRKSCGNDLGVESCKVYGDPSTCQQNCSTIWLSGGTEMPNPAPIQ
jgi:hypothetical protein